MRTENKGGAGSGIRIRFGLRMKIMLMFAAIMLLTASAVFLFFFEGYCKKRRENLVAAAINDVENMLDEGQFDEFTGVGKIEWEYTESPEYADELREGSEIDGVYVVLTKDRDDENGAEEGEPQDAQGEPQDGQQEISDWLGGDVFEYGDETLPGFGACAVCGVIYDGDGQPEAVVFVKFNKINILAECIKFINDIISNTKKEILAILAVIAAAAVLGMLGIIQLRVIKPVRRLKEQAERVMEGDFSVVLPVRGHDDLSIITEVFNRMTRSIDRSMDNIKSLNKAYQRYVPSRILTIYKKESILDIKLGDEAEAMLSVFSFQISGFWQNIQGKTPGEMLEAINRVLGLSVAEVLEYKGMVESFREAGFTALFEGSCGNALSCAVTVCQRLNRGGPSGGGAAKSPGGNYNGGFVGIGIAYGRTSLSIIGQKERLAAVTLSQYRDMSAWLRDISDKYHAHILVTQETADGTEGFFETYHTRTLGFMRNSHTGYIGRVYDVYDGDSGEDFALKEATRETFEKGVEYYCMREYMNARRCFISVLRRYGGDSAAREYLYICDKKCNGGDTCGDDIYFAEME